MKTLTLKLLILLVLSAFVGCKENDPDPVTSTESLEGIWIGKYGNASKVPDWFWSFKIEPKGVIHELNSNGDKIGKGIWTKVGTEFTATYHNDEPYDATYSIRATFSESEGTLKGSWGYGNNENDGGTFVLNKKRPLGFEPPRR